MDGPQPFHPRIQRSANQSESTWRGVRNDRDHEGVHDGSAIGRCQLHERGLPSVESRHAVLEDVWVMCETLCPAVR